MRITYIGHATLLIEIGGKKILTDPNFDSSLGLVLARVSAPGIAIADLPELDMIVLTHAHADHLSFRSLAEIQQVPLFAPPAIARWIRRKGVARAIDFGPGESLTSGGVTIHADAAAHSGTRYFVDQWRRQANMYLFDTNTESIFFAGDTALREDTTSMVMRVLGERRLDVALLPIGYAPSWKVGFRHGHLTSTDALMLFERLNARYFIPYHWGTFNHVTASAHDAIRELREQVKNHLRGADVRILDPGESFNVVPVAQ
ncbi:MAG: MBL fold metallo-hydrolase [Gemmatimonadaceae bacterium]